MASQTQHIYDNFGRFVSECKNFVKAIENYKGTDPLAPWYEYLLWMEENFVINSKQDTIFDEILANCLCRFEHEERYKQDRRLIKLFIKFVHVQDEQNMHYDAMVTNGFGSKVADLYINWAFYFDMHDNFTKADQIFKHGISAKAEPFDLLRSAHQQFCYSMSQRILYKSDETFQKANKERMQRHLEEIAALRIDGTRPKLPKSLALQMYDNVQSKNVCIPRDGVANQTPEKRHNTSVAQTIIDSARKMRREKSHKLSTTSCRLDFNDNSCESSANVQPKKNEQNLFENGIKLGRNFRSKNLPQTQPPPIAYADPAIGTFRGERPGYDKIMLVPATNKAFSPDELKAYKWFKNRGIVNAFTREQDKIWGIGFSVPIRWANVFARTNFPQPEWNVPRISVSDDCSERGPHKFMCNMVELYPANSLQEYSLDEIVWRKRQMAKSKTALSVDHSHKSGHSKTNRTLNRTNSIETKLSPIVEMELSGCGDALIEVPRKKESIYANATTADANKKRKSSMFPAFDALNDTCTTQMFGNLLHSTAISTPKVKMPKFDESIDEHFEEETKLKLFTDQSSSELLHNAMKQTGKDIKTDLDQPKEFGFAIYEDKTLAIQGSRNVAVKDIANNTIGNKENILLPENQLINFEQLKLPEAQYRSEFGQIEAAVINSKMQPNENAYAMEPKEEPATRQPNGFPFEIYADKTESMMKAFENARAILNCETSSENKENISFHPNKSAAHKSNKSIEEDIAAVNKMIESVLNATKVDGVADKEKTMFKEPPTPKLPPIKTEAIQRPNETRFCDTLDTTEDFEFMEAQCANSPSEINKSTDIVTINLEQNFAKNVSISAAKKAQKNNTSYRLSDIVVTEEEKKFILDNPCVSDKTRLNWTCQQSGFMAEPSIAEENDDENDLAKETEEEEDIGKSIYVKQPELEFREEDADWKEVSQFLADVTATNEYKVEEVNLNETRQRIDTHMLNLKELNPFEPEVQKDVLTDIGFLDQLNGANNFNCVMMNIVQPLKPRSSIEINEKKYQIRKLIGTGAFGKVFLAECTKTKETYAFKQQRPPNLWEYYVCLQVHTRIADANIRKGFMAVDFAMIGNNATIFASKFSKYGTILDVCNKVKQSTNKIIDECIVMILVKQMFTIIEHFHKAKFIHADVKPDNFLLMEKLGMNYEHPDIVMQLIDFGQAIDLSYFSNHVFWAKVKTENFICTEMMENKPWTFHCDFFCLASTIYTMVAGKYMVVSHSKTTNTYKTQKLPRYVNGALWEEIFDALINIPSLKKMPSMSKLHKLLDDELRVIGSKKVTEAIVKFNKALD